MPQIELNGGGGAQSVYTQLTQNISDSDSEDNEEVRFQCNTRRFNMNQLTAPTIADVSRSLSSHTVISDIDASDVAAIFNNGVNSTNIQTDDGETRAGHLIIGNQKPMGPLRRICFCISIIICFASMAIFLWAFPCNSDLSCPVRRAGHSDEAGEADTGHNWIRDFENVEFKSVISVSDGVAGYGKNLIFMYRSNKIFGESSEVPQSHHNGIIALVAGRGKIAWYHQMVDEPNRIDCGLLDVDKDGRPECLVIDEYGQLGCLNPMSGQWMWHISLYQEPTSNNSNSKSVRRKAIDLLDFPLILPDIDGDGVNDLLLVTSLEQIHHNNFLFVSGGANGRPIGMAYSLTSCQFVHKLNLEEGLNLVFNCINNDTELTKKMSLLELYKLATGGQQLLRMNRLLKPPIEQHKFYGQRRNTPNQRNIYSSGFADLIVENSGKCPLNCTMLMNLIIDGSPTINVIQGSAMYGMVPAVLTTKNNTGFVIKLWEWIEYDGNDRFESTTEDHTDSKSQDDGAHLTNYDQDIQVSNKKLGSNGGFKDLVKRKIKEHVVLIMFNNTSHKVINTSQSDVIQFCTLANGMNNCQPDMNYQENSITIADLDQDGYKELISYYSTFVENVAAEQWKLTTYVQQFRLETELMSLNDT